ncbi:dimethyladenosine transferase mitochondrial [Brachionus plicatilis]|uniref:Dimethyladenosine transferase mitochondrial n=1 Tax=Brachionus plicatilis TaxID=10195 RepID=A0A3M7QMF7_BRAPC|nr:dimethyladenosine transferase mitochondrial [Brachionus plicatilis]
MIKNHFKILTNLLNYKNLSTHHRILTQKELSEKIRLKNAPKNEQKIPSLSQKKAKKRPKTQIPSEEKAQDTALVRPGDEKAFLNQASFKIRIESLDDPGRELLSKMESLSKTSTDPKHLSIIHQGLNKKIHDLIEKNTKSPLDQDLNTLVELNAGFGLLTSQFLKSKSKFSKFLLIEPFSKFDPHLNQLKNQHPDLHLLKANPFSDTFLFESTPVNRKKIVNSLKTDRKLIKNINLTIYSIVPWNSKVFLNRLFSKYCSNQGFFGLNKMKLIDEEELSVNFGMPEFYLFIPEILMAKMNPSLDKKFAKYKGRLSVFSSILSSAQVLDVVPVDYFFPYPLMSKIQGHSDIDFKKMYLIHLKFKQKSLVDDHKRLFYLFVSNVYCHRREFYIKDCVKGMCNDPEELLDRIGIWKYTKLSHVSPYQLMKMFNILVEDKHLSTIDNLLFKSEKHLDPNKEHKRATELKKLKKINQNLSGQLILPNKNS